MKKLILFLFISISLFSEAQVQMSQVSGLIPKLNSKQDTIPKGTGFLKRSGLVWSYDPSTYLTSFTETDPIFGSSVAKTINAIDTVKWNAKQPALYGAGFVKANGSTISYDQQTYLTITSLSPYSTTAQANALYEAKFAQGYANQYLRGDKTWQLFPTNLSSFTNDLGNYGGWITGINSSNVATALGYTPEQPLTFSTGLTRSGNTITNNITQYTDALARSAQTNSSITTALGYTPWYTSNHPTTVSGYGITDAILNQNSSAQSGNIWISGNGKFGGGSAVTGELSLNFNNPDLILNSISSNSDNSQSKIFFNKGETRLWMLYNDISANNGQTFAVRDYISGIDRLSINSSGAATFSSTVNATGFLLNGNNLTSALSTNYISKWNGSNFTNSTLIESGGNIGNATPLYKLHIRTNIDGNVGFRNPTDFNSLWTTGSVIGCFNDANSADMPLYVESSSLGLNRASGAEVITGGQLTTRQINSIGSSNWYGAVISGSDATDNWY